MEEGSRALVGQSNCQFGAFVELNHEPSAQEVAAIASDMYGEILRKVIIQKLDYTKIIVRSADEERANDPLNKVQIIPTGKWTIGVKVSCFSAMYPEGCVFSLSEGVTGHEFTMADKLRSTNEKG